MNHSIHRAALYGTAIAALLHLSSFGTAQAAIQLANTAAGINSNGGAAVPGANVGSHYHLLPNNSTMLVNRWLSEEGRGVAEFSLGSVTESVANATLSFRLSQYGNPPLNAPMVVVAYAGDGSIEITDFQAPSVGSVGTFTTVGAVVGDTFSFDVTSLYNSMIGNTLGIRIQLASDPGTGTFRDVFFNQIQIETVAAGGVVPEPSTFLVWGGLACCFGLVVKRLR